MNFKKDRKNRDVTIDIVPLINCVFLLFIFFMVSSAKDMPEPMAQEVVRKKEDITIVMKFNNDIIFNQKTVDLDELKLGLLEIAKKDVDVLVIIKADAGVSHGKVVAVMDMARGVGLNQLAIATRPQS